MTEYPTFNLGYSLKNIPIADEGEYMLKIIDKVRNFIRRLRIKVQFSAKDNSEESQHQTYGIPSTYTPKASPLLTAFENDLIEAISKIKFKTNLDNFQKQLQADVEKIRKSDKIIVEADKTSNLYELTKEQYLKLLEENVTANYKKVQNSTVDIINKEAKKITSDLKLDDRVRALPLKEAFITLKDHKQNFKSNPKCRLLNPTKSEVGIISKKIISDINKTIRASTNLTQWTNTDQVIKWFKNLERKKYQFLKFDVVEFYPSISRDLLNKALNFAKKYAEIDKTDRKIINNATKSVLLFDGKIWSKKNPPTKDDALFDITMGGYHGAEICELVGLYMLNGLEKIIPNGKVGLYRDDGLAVIPMQSGSVTERLKKKLHSFAKSIGLRLEIDEPSTKTEYLDVFLDLNNMTFSPYRKPNSEIRYINSKSNHPKNITSQMTKMIENLISSRSCNEEVFNKVADVYNKALADNGHKANIIFREQKQKPKQRKRSKIWFNPPFCKSVDSNIGKTFIKLVKKHFYKGSPLYPIINNHKIGFSYSCMPNIKAIIASHNKKILNSTQKEADKNCNCRKDKTTKKVNCPVVNGSCRSKNIIYKASVKTGKETNFYIGLSSTEFKQRWGNHNNSFKYREKLKATALATHIWKLKDQNKSFNISYRIIGRANTARSDSNTCRLCLKEAAEIMKNKKNQLNKRHEITGKCRHTSKFYLNNWKSTLKDN